MSDYPEHDLDELVKGVRASLEFYDDAAQSNNAVALNERNVLVPGTGRLPIGWKVLMPQDMSSLRIWVPTHLGGRLTVFHLAGSDPVQLRRNGKPSRIVRPGQAAVVEVPAGEFGEFFVARLGTASDLEVGCTFEQESLAMDSIKSSVPLIPWNFHFWSISPDTGDPDKERAILTKYSKATKKQNPDEAGQWETVNHIKDGAAFWEGHCHSGAGASIVFREPADTTVNGQSFTKTS